MQQISTPLEFRQISKYGEYELTSDIDFQGCTNPIPEIKNFCGVIDGNNHVLKNIKTEPDHFFSKVEDSATIKDLKLDVEYVGKLPRRTGIFYNCNGELKNISVKLDFNTEPSSENLILLGGLCGQNKGTIDDCHVHLKLHDHSSTISNLGGVVTRNVSTIKNTTFYGNISIRSQSCTIGGIAALSEENSSIKNCKVNADIHAFNRRTGAIAGFCDAPIVNSTAIGNFNTLNGLLVANINSNQETIRNSYGFFSKEDIHSREIPNSFRNLPLIQIRKNSLEVIKQLFENNTKNIQSVDYSNYSIEDINNISDQKLQILHEYDCITTRQFGMNI